MAKRETKTEIKLDYSEICGLNVRLADHLNYIQSFSNIPALTTEEINIVVSELSVIVTEFIRSLEIES